MRTEISIVMHINTNESIAIVLHNTRNYIFYNYTNQISGKQQQTHEAKHSVLQFSKIQ